MSTRKKPLTKKHLSRRRQRRTKNKLCAAVNRRRASKRMLKQNKRFGGSRYVLSFVFGGSTYYMVEPSRNNTESYEEYRQLLSGTQAFCFLHRVNLTKDYVSPVYIYVPIFAQITYHPQNSIIIPQYQYGIKNRNMDFYSLMDIDIEPLEISLCALECFQLNRNTINLLPQLKVYKEQDHILEKFNPNSCLQYYMPCDMDQDFNYDELEEIKRIYPRAIDQLDF